MGDLGSRKRKQKDDSSVAVIDYLFVMCLVKGEFQYICLVTVHAHEVPKQRPLGFERNGGQIEETAETQEELCKKCARQEKRQV